MLTGGIGIGAFKYVLKRSYFYLSRFRSCVFCSVFKLNCSEIRAGNTLKLEAVVFRFFVFVLVFMKSVRGPWKILSECSEIVIFL